MWGVWRGATGVSVPLTAKQVQTIVVAADSNGEYDACSNTQICFKTLNPEWNETFSLQVSAADERSTIDLIGITVFDYDSVGAHDFMGLVVVPLRPVGREWLKLELPPVEHEGIMHPQPVIGCKWARYDLFGPADQGSCFQMR